MIVVSCEIDKQREDLDIVVIACIGDYIHPEDFEPIWEAIRTNSNIKIRTPYHIYLRRAECEDASPSAPAPSFVIALVVELVEEDGKIIEPKFRRSI